MNAFFLKFLFTGAKRRLTWRKMAALLDHDVPVRQVLVMLRNRQMEHKSPLAQVFSNILGEMDRGTALDKALAPWVPQEETMLIRGGLRGNNIPKALRDCVDLVEAKTKIIQSLVGAVAYPSLLMGMLIVFVLILALYLIPEISTLFDPATLVGSAAWLYTIMNFVASPLGLAVFILLALLALSTVATLPFWTGKWRLMVENIPPWSIYRLVVGSVWLFTMATLLRANIQLEVIFSDMLKSGAMRPYLAERVKTIKERYRSESNFGRLLLRLNMHFPSDELVEEMAVYATLPSFYRNLYDIAKEWLDDGIRRISKMSQILNIGLMLSIIAMVAWIAVASHSLRQQLMTGIGGF
jgi:type II secretory pathway component PulF